MFENFDKGLKNVVERIKNTLTDCSNISDVNVRKLIARSEHIKPETLFEKVFKEQIKNRKK